MEFPTIKQNFQIFSFLLICLCAFSGVFAQQKADLFKELNELQQKARELRAGKSYRVKTTIEDYDETGKKLKSKQVSILENIPPNRSYYSSTAESAGVTKKVEVIVIGEALFYRKDDGEWGTSQPEPRISMSGTGVSSGVQIIEETTLNGQPVKVYEKKGSVSTGLGDFSEDDRYWFTSEGELLKSENERVNIKTNERSRIVTVDEYDPDIKIEAPIK